MSTASIHSPLIKRARQEVVFLSSSLFDRCIGATIEALEDAERKSRAIGVRMELGEAWAALSKHRAELRGAFPARLDTAMALALDTARHAAVAPTRQILSEDDLALVEDAEVSRFVEASRLQQTVMPVVEESLALLDSLMSSALGLPVVRADLNPLRPDVACGAVMELLDTLPEPRRRSQAVLDLAWLIEELRVSLFAQGLGTADRFLKGCLLGSRVDACGLPSCARRPTR